ncbi:MAG: mechanosensitive ion channel [Pyramidobacter sp.]|nr:mechanosensitive ion channel [Pyramidobacter sp.]
MKKKSLALALLLALALARAAAAVDAVSLLTGGSVTEDADAGSNASGPVSAQVIGKNAVISPFSPASDAEECARRERNIGRQLDDWNELRVSDAAVRFGVSEEAVARRKEVLASLKNLYPAIISVLSRKAHIENMLARLKEDITAPELTLTEKPPFALNYYNTFIDQLEGLNSLVDDAQYDLDNAAAATERAQKLVDEREAQWRLARDTFDRERTPQTTWALADAAFLTEAARAEQVLAGIRHENAATVLATRKLARDRHIRLRTYIRDHLDLEKKIFEAQVSELADQVKKLEALRTDLGLQYKQAQDNLAAAHVKYASARDEARAAALIERNMREDERDGARLKLEHLQGHLDILAARRHAWTLRYDIARGAADLRTIPDVVKDLKEHVQLLDEQLSVTQKDMLTMQGRFAAVEKQIDAGVTDVAVLDMLRRDRDAVQAAIDDSLAYAALLLSMKAQEHALIEELEEKYHTVPLWQKLSAWWQEKGVRLLNTELWQSGGYAVRLREFLIALALIVLGNWAARRVFALLLWSLSKRFNIDETSRRSLTRLFSYLAGMAIFLGALRIVGIPLTAFAFLGGAIAIGIGFGTQNLFKNLISGILLTLKRPFRLGNVIEVDDVLGSVFDIGVSATIIRTFDGKDVIIPNSDLLEKQLVNWSLSDSLLRSRINVGVQYGTSPKRLREVLLSVMAANPHVLRFPEPLVRLVDYGSSELDFEVVFWVNQRLSSAHSVACQLREDFLYAMNEAGLEMAYPHLDVTMLTPRPQPEAERDVPRDSTTPA